MKNDDNLCSITVRLNLQDVFFINCGPFQWLLLFYFIFGFCDFNLQLVWNFLALIYRMSCN